jgi:Surface antigen variable number repeat
MRLALLVAGFFLFSSVVFGQNGPPPLIPERKTMKTRDGNAPPPEQVTAPKTPADGEDDEEDEPIDCGDDPINRIRFIGNLGGFSEEQLFEAMPEYNRFRVAPQARRYCSDVYEERDLPRLEAFFKKQGFPETTLELPPDLDSRSGELIVRVNVRRPAVVGKVTAFGVESLPYDQVVGTLTTGEAAVVSRGNQMYLDSGPRPGDTCLRGETAVTELYRQAGFADAFVRVLPKFRNQRTDDEKELVDFEIFIEERPLGTVRTTEFTGNNGTRDKVVRRELLIGEGDPFCHALLDRSLENIRRLGLFSDVRVTSIDFDKKNRTVDITISVTETAETVRKEKTEQEHNP